MDYDIIILYKCRKCRLKKEADEYGVNIENKNYIFKTCKVCRTKYISNITNKFHNKIINNYC